MKQKNLDNIKNRLFNTLEYISKLNDQKRELENDPKVKEYIYLLTSISKLKRIKLNSSEDQILLESINMEDIKETNRIYLYLGSFVAPIMYKDEQRVKKHETYDYSKYIDIEKNLSEIIKIPADQDKIFEESNAILYPTTEYNPTDDYHRIRYEFFKEAIETTQEIAVQKILKKYK